MNISIITGPDDTNSPVTNVTIGGVSVAETDNSKRTAHVSWQVQPHPDEQNDDSSKTTVTPDTDAVRVQTVTPYKNSSIKRLWTMLGLGGVSIGTYIGQISGFFKSVDPTLMKWVVILGLSAVVLYMIGQFVNGVMDRYIAWQMNKLQAQSASSTAVNTIKFVPPESGTKE